MQPQTQQPHNITTLSKLIFRKIYDIISPDNHKRAVFEMDNNQTQEHIDEKKQLFYPSNENNSDIKFLFKKCDVPEILMSYWITIPEFVNKILEVKNSNATIDNVIVFKIMKGIYEEKLADRENGVDTDFKFQPVRRGLRVLSEIVTGDRENWNK